MPTPTTVCLSNFPLFRVFVLSGFRVCPMLMRESQKRASIAERSDFDDQLASLNDKAGNRLSLRCRFPQRHFDAQKDSKTNRCGLAIIRLPLPMPVSVAIDRARGTRKERSSEKRFSFGTILPPHPPPSPSTPAALRRRPYGPPLTTRPHPRRVDINHRSSTMQRLKLGFCLMAVLALSTQAFGEDSKPPKEVKALPLFFVAKGESPPTKQQTDRSAEADEFGAAPTRRCSRAATPSRWSRANRRCIAPSTTPPILERDRGRGPADGR